MELETIYDLAVIGGGKITTYRHLAEEAVDLLAARLPVLEGTHWTGSAPLPGGDFAIDGGARLEARFVAQVPFLREAAHRLIRAYGTTAFTIFDGVRSLADCGEDFGHGLTAREVRHLVTREWACSAEDVLWRRSKLGLRLSSRQAEALERFNMQERAE